VPWLFTFSLFDQHDIEADDPGGASQGLGKARACSPVIPGYQFLDVQAGFTGNLNNKSAGFFPGACDSKDPAFADFVSAPVCDPLRRALADFGAGQGIYGRYERIC